MYLHQIVNMRLILILFLIVFPYYTLARHIKESTSDSLLWYPKRLNNKPPISPEFSWLYLEKHNNLADLITRTDNLFLYTDYTMEDIINQTSFYLYTKKNREIPQKLMVNDLNSIKDSNWDPEIPTRIIVHGYVADYTADYVQLIKDKFLDLIEPNNVIAFDWGPIANLIYPNSASLTDKVGEVCSIMIDVLSTLGGQSDKVHLIGHSLGAHVAGFAAKFTNVGIVGRVTGLDPAYPGFITEDENGRLDSSDAEFVDCIHTCAGLVAFERPICHADYYPNGGSSPQPGCFGFFESTGCSHSRSHDLFAESIINGHEFPALTCTEIPKTGPVKCIKQGALMGYPAESKFKGIFYVVTKDKFPYAPVVPTSKSTGGSV